jgi:hypothetical protein
MYLKIGFNFNKSQTPIFFNLQSLRDSVYTSAIMSIDLRLVFRFSISENPYYFSYKQKGVKNFMKKVQL